MKNIMVKLSVAIFVILAMALFVVVVGAGESERMPTKDSAFSSRSVENGADIFANNCVGCHGIQGQGIPGVAPALNSPEFFTTRLEQVGYAGSLRSFIEGTVNAGRPVGSGQYSAKMATWGQEYGGPLRPDQISDVASFILNWEKAYTGEEVVAAATPTPKPAGYPPDASPVDIGMAVYAAQGCVGCHGEPGGAGLVGPNLGGVATRATTRVPGQSAEEYIKNSIVNPNDYIVPECPGGPCAPGLMPQTYGQTLTEQELNGLVQYLLTLE